MEYAKCACIHCGGHIEFPSEAAGRAITCPHCGQATTLTVTLAETPPHNTGALKWMAIGAACLVLAAVAAVMLKVRVSDVAPRTLKAKVSSLERAAANNPGAVAGVVENGAARQRQGVRVEIELLNARGEPLWLTTAFAPAIEPNKSWNFRASVVDPNVVTARVARVRELGK